MFTVTIDGDPAKAAAWISFAKKKALLHERLLSNGGQKRYNLDQGGYVRITRPGNLFKIHISINPGVPGYEFYLIYSRANNQAHYLRVDSTGVDAEDVETFSAETVGVTELGQFDATVNPISQLTQVEHSASVRFGVGERNGDSFISASRHISPKVRDVASGWDYNTHDRTYPAGTSIFYYDTVAYSGMFRAQPWRGRFFPLVNATSPISNARPLQVPDGLGGSFAVLVSYVLEGTAFQVQTVDTGVITTVTVPNWLNAPIDGSPRVNWKANHDNTRVAGVIGPRDFFWNVDTDQAVAENDSADRFYTHNYGYLELVFSGGRDSQGAPILSAQLGRNWQNHGCVLDVDYPWDSPETLRILRTSYKVGGWLQAIDTDDGEQDALLKIAIFGDWIDVDLLGAEGVPYRQELLYHGPFAATFRHETKTTNFLDWGSPVTPEAYGGDLNIWPKHNGYYVRPSGRAWEPLTGLHDLVKDNSPYHYIHRRLVASDLKSDSYCLRREELFPVALVEAIGFTEAYWVAHHLSREHKVWTEPAEVATAGTFTLKTPEDLTGYADYNPTHYLWSDFLNFATYQRNGLSELIRLIFPEPYYDYQQAPFEKLNMYFRDWGFIESQPDGSWAAYVPKLPYYYGTDAGIEGYPDLDSINFAYVDSEDPEGTISYRTTSHAAMANQAWFIFEGTLSTDTVDLLAASGVWGRSP